MKWEELKTPGAVLAAFEAGRKVEWTACTGNTIDMPPSSGGWIIPRALDHTIGRYRALIEDPAIPAGYTPWGGGECPEEVRGRLTWIIYGDGLTIKTMGEYADWRSSRAPDGTNKHDVIAYRVESEQAQPSRQGELVDDALEEAFRRYPHAHDALTFLACAIRGPVKPSKADLEWAVSQAFQDGNATILAEPLGRDAEGMDTLYDAASKGFHVSETCGPDGKYQYVSKFKTMAHLHAFHEAWVKVMVSVRDKRAALTAALTEADSHGK